jgi:hypothetical protein
MSIADALSAISQIQQQIAELMTGTTAASAATGTGASTSGVVTSGTAGTADSGAAATSTSTADAAQFASLLAQAQADGSGSASTATTPALETTALAGLSGTAGALTSASALPVSTLGTVTASTGGVALPAGASAQLTTGQQQFAQTLAADTGLNPGVVSAWLLAEQSGPAAQARQQAGNNDWLNIGYTDSGTYGSADAVWANPVSAANATAGWLEGQNTIPGYGSASSGIQAILTTVGQPPATQIAALQNSGWASSGYPDLPSIYAQIAG